MAEPVWYYARDDAEKGPLSTAEIRALVVAGKIHADDYVWREGMETWVPAGEHPELKLLARKGRTEPRRPEGEPAQDKPADDEVPLATTVDEPLSRWASAPSPMVSIHGGLALAVLMILAARGCDALGRLQVARLHARRDAAEQEFLMEWQQARAALIRQHQASSSGQPGTLSEQLAALDRRKETERSELEKGTWQELAASAELAGAREQMWALWRGALYVLGLVLLVGGLGAAGWLSAPPMRWFYLVSLAAVVYGIAAQWLVP